MISEMIHAGKTEEKNRPVSEDLWQGSEFLPGSALEDILKQFWFCLARKLRMCRNMLFQSVRRVFQAGNG